MKAGAFILPAALVFVFSCHPRQEWPLQEQALPELFSLQAADSLAPLSSDPALQACVLEVTRTGCGGPCPEWVARYYPGGVATLVNQKSVLPTGAYRTDFSPDSLRWVFEAASDCGFFQLPDTVGFIPQLPGWKIAIREDSTRREIIHNHGGPLALHRLENCLEKWILAQHWERIDR